MLPDVLEIVEGEPAMLEFMVIKLPDVPRATKLDTVWILPEVKVTVLGAPIVMVLKVLES